MPLSSARRASSPPGLVWYAAALKRRQTAARAYFQARRRLHQGPAGAVVRAPILSWSTMPHAGFQYSYFVSALLSRVLVPELKTKLPLVGRLIDHSSIELQPMAEVQHRRRVRSRRARQVDASKSHAGL